MDTSPKKPNQDLFPNLEKELDFSAPLQSYKTSNVDCASPYVSLPCTAKFVFIDWHIGRAGQEQGGERCCEEFLHIIYVC